MYVELENIIYGTKDKYLFNLLTKGVGLNSKISKFAHQIPQALF